MLKKKYLRVFALITVAVLCLGLFASCASSKDDGLNGVTGSVSGNVTAGNNQESAGDRQDNTANNNANNNENNPGNEQQPGTETPSGNSQSGTEDPDTPVTNTPEGGEEENDPYAAMKVDKSGTKLKLLCQNVRYNAFSDRGTTNSVQVRRHRFKKLVAKYDPDVIAIQEGCNAWLQVLPEDFGDEYDMFYKGAERPSPDDEESSPILWKRSKYTKVDDGYFWVSETPDVPSSCFFPGYHNFIINWVELQDKATGQNFRIYSSHFGLDLKPEHLHKVRHIYEKKMSDMDANTYAFVAGDLNITYQSPEYLAFVNEVSLTDVRDLATAMSENGHCTLGDIRQGTFNAFKHPDGGAIGDHILAVPRKHLAIDTYGYCYEQFDGYVSDHFAVYTEVRMNSDVSYAEYYADTAK